MQSGSQEKMGNDGEGRGGGGGRPLSGKTTRTSRSKKDKLQRVMREIDAQNQGGDEQRGSWLTEELLMMFEDEDGEFLNFTPSVRSRVSLASKRVRTCPQDRPRRLATTPALSTEAAAACNISCIRNIALPCVLLQHAGG